MEMCRVCLSTEKGMQPLDEIFVLQYNLLTNLNITLLDGMPQFSCKTCLDTVKYFIEFREKSIASEETIRESIHSILKLKVEDTDSKAQKNSKGISNAIKLEIKEEADVDIDTTIDDFFAPLEDYTDDTGQHLKDEDVKPRQLRKRKNCKEKQKDSTKLLQKIFATDIKPKEINKRRASSDDPKGVKKRKTDNDEKVALKAIILDTGNWTCGICPQQFEEETDLNKHLDVHKDDRNCQLCEEKSNSYSQLLGHRLKHVSTKQKKCHICNKKCKSCLNLEHHYRILHIEHDGPKLVCKICSATFMTPRRLRAHMSGLHSGVRLFCDVCSKSFTSKINLKSHMKHHTAKKNYVCDLCGFSCNYGSGLKDHKVRKHSQMKINCKKCTRAFQSEQDLERHTCKSHLKICSVCGLQVNGANRLSRHMLVHSNVFKFECERCPAKYKSKSALKVHYNRHDGNRAHECEFCHEKFFTAAVMIKHRRTHTGEKPFVCKVCSKGFTGRHNLRVHMRVHGEYLIVKKNSENDVNNVTNPSK